MRRMRPARSSGKARIWGFSTRAPWRRRSRAGPDVEAALADYARARRRHVRFYQRASYWLTPLFQSDGRIAAAVRDVAFPAMKAVPYLRRETVRALAGMKTGLFTSL